MMVYGNNYCNNYLTSTAGNSYDWMHDTTGTGDQYCQQTSTYPIYHIYTLDPEAIRLQELVERRREPLQRWSEQNAKLLSERQKKEEAEASELARRLLLEYLDEKNRNNFAAEKPLEVESGIHQDVIYHIPKYGRIKAWKGDEVISELCLQVKAPEWIPHEDTMLAKLLLLQCDEVAALRTANHSNIKQNLLEGLN